MGTIGLYKGYATLIWVSYPPETSLEFRELQMISRVTHWGNIRVILELYLDNGKENGSY